MTTTTPNGTQVSAWNGAVGRHWADNADRYDAVSASFNDALLHAAAIGERDRVLDVGCGNGQVTRLAATAARHGSAIGIDVSAPMLEGARALTWDQDYRNVSYVEGDAQVYPFPEGGYDVAVSRGGVMFFDDLVAAFGNIRSALRPGGRLAIMTPDAVAPDSTGWKVFGALNALLSAHAPERDPARDPAPRMGSLATAERIRDVLTGAGFAAVEPKLVHADVVWGRDAADAARFMVGIGEARLGLDGLDPATMARLRAEMAAVLVPYETPDGIRVPDSAWITTATRP